MDDNGGISKGGEIPWRCPEDQQFFKLLTSGGDIIMGRKTADTFGRPLPSRTNYVLSKNVYDRRGFHAITEEDIYFNLTNWEDTFVIGGAEIYHHFLENQYIKTMYISHIDGDYECDTRVNLSKYMKTPLLLASFSLSDYCTIEKYKVSY